MCPVPVARLTQSFYPYTTQAFPRNQREFWERQGALRIMFVCGYLYVNPGMGGRPPEAALARALLDGLKVTMRHWQIEGQIDGPALMAIRNLTVWYQQRFPGRRCGRVTRAPSPLPCMQRWWPGSLVCQPWLRRAKPPR